MKFLQGFCFVNIFVGFLYLVNGDTEETYKAAVVEYSVLKYDSIFDEVDTVLSDYIDKIEEAKDNNADIIVFPELTINSQSPITVPDGSLQAQPWNEPEKYSKVLTRLSEAARTHSIYVLVNVAEKELNETSESGRDQFIYYNTNFVLNPEGTIISRYRKINLYGEAGRTPSIDKKLGVFETNFGVKFGHFICFDILFQLPALQVLHKENITNIVYPTMWFSEMPFLTAVEIQESYAYTTNVNLLAAGANQPSVGSTGTGIYSGKRGKLKAVMHGTSKSEILYADVPKDPRKKIDSASIKKQKTNRNTINALVMDNLFLKQDNLTVYATEILKGNGEVMVRHGDVRCSANVTFIQEDNKELPMYVYRLVVYDGIRSYTYATGGVSDCAVVACTDESITSCARRFPNHSEVWPKNTISSIDLRFDTPAPVWNDTVGAYSRIYFPVTLDTSIMPLPIDDYTYHTTDSNEGGNFEIFMKIKEVYQYDNILLTFGITGRVFARDGLVIPGSGNINTSGLLVLIISFILTTCYIL